VRESLIVFSLLFRKSHFFSRFFFFFSNYANFASYYRTIYAKNEMQVLKIEITKRINHKNSAWLRRTEVGSNPASYNAIHLIENISSL